MRHLISLEEAKDYAKQALTERFDITWVATIYNELAGRMEDESWLTKEEKEELAGLLIAIKIQYPFFLDHRIPKIIDYKARQE